MDVQKRDFISLVQENENLRRELIKCRDFDSVTGLYNRNAFYEKVRALLLEGIQADYFLICIDIERFKLVNDLYGMGEGDRLLRYIARQIRLLLEEEGGVAARFSGDVFALCTPLPDMDMEALQGRVVGWLDRYPLDMEIIPAIGVYEIRDDDTPVNLICDRAILALNSVKGNYLNHIAKYNTVLRNSILEEQDLINDTEKALERHEFQVYLQPKCDMRNGKIVGAEALVRWRHPRRGMVSPDTFIPIFERTGFILKLDAFVWEQVCKLLRGWMDKGYPVPPVSVNVSRMDLFVDDFPGLIIGLVKKYGLDASLLELEITESVYSKNTEHIFQVVDALRKYGFTILMDDFGSGYSSLNMLKDINVDILKIDLKFLANEDKPNARSADIIESVVRMAKWLDLRVIAEGVETRKQIDFLLKIGCFYAQGYYFYKPLSAEAYEALLQEGEHLGQALTVEVGDEIIELEDLLHDDTISSTLLNNILGGVVLYQYKDNNLAILRVNEEYYRLTGCSPESLSIRGQHILDWVHDEDKAVFLATRKCAKERPKEGGEATIRRYRVDGRLMWMHMRLFFLSEKGGREIYYASVNDISEQKESEEKLRRSEERLRLALESTANAIFEYDIESQTVDYVEEYSGYYGLEPNTGKVPEILVEQEIVHPEDAERFTQIFEIIRRGGSRKARCEVRVRNAAGDYVLSRVTLTEKGCCDEKPRRALGLVENFQRNGLPD